MLEHMRPLSPGLTTASTHLLATALWPVLCPTTVLTVNPPSAQSPFAQCECDPIGETHFPSPQRTLLLLFRSYGLIRQSQRALLYFGFASLEESSQVVYQSLLPAGPSRRYLRVSFLGCWIPYPGGPTACLYLFLPLCHRPSPQGTGSASRL